MVVAKTTRRFGAHDVANGPFKDAVHVGTKRYQIFSGQLNYLHNYLSQRLLPTEPEDVTMQGILIILQNLLEHECEVLIRHYVTKAGTIKDHDFQQRIENGYVSFKSKCDWLLARKLIKQADWDIMDEVRRLRNEYAHSRPSERRQRFRYKGFQLLTQRGIQRLFVDIELTLRQIRSQAGQRSRWMTVPPGYASPGSTQLIPRRLHLPTTRRTVSPVTCRRDSQTGSTLTAIRS